jgi:hypothetical protein
MKNIIAMFMFAGMVAVGFTSTAAMAMNMGHCTTVRKCGDHHHHCKIVKVCKHRHH